MKERFVKAVNLLTAEREEIYGTFKEIEEQIFGMREQLGQVRERIGERMVKREGMERFLSEVKGQRDVVTEFDEGQWYSLVDVVTVFSMEDMCFIF